MKKNYLLYYLILVPCLCSGQISLNATMAPQLNTAIIYHDANVPSPAFTFAKSGINNTWDFSAISPVSGADDTLFVSDPSSIPGGAAFPTASHCTYEGGDGSKDMLLVNSNGITLLGFVNDPLNTGTLIPLSANPSVLTMSFPYTYGNSSNLSTYIQVFNTGAAIGQPTYDSVRYKSSFSAIISVIAAGNIILPSGTFPSLLERGINTSIDSAWVKGATTLNQWILVPGFPEITIDSSFYWYSNQSLLHYAHALYDDTGLHDVHYYKSQITTGLNQTLNPMQQVSVFPNPSSGFLNLKVPDLSDVKQWSIYSIDGKELLKGVNDLSRINIQGLNTGSYVLQLQTNEGHLHQVRFIKN